MLTDRRPAWMLAKSSRSRIRRFIAVARALDRLDLAARPLLLVGRQVALEQQRGRRQHDAQRIAQIVRDDRQQILARAQRVLRLADQAYVVQLDARAVRSRRE
jgi:hypothetical protein